MNNISKNDLLKLANDNLDEDLKEQERKIVSSVNTFLSKLDKHFFDLDFQLTVVLGTTIMTIDELINTEEEDVIVLDRNAGASADAFLTSVGSKNQRYLFKGEILVYEDFFSLRVQEIGNSQVVFSHFQEEYNSGTQEGIYNEDDLFKDEIYYEDEDSFNRRG
ncbi:hypothetical protein HOK00_00895 [bacterium]|jgi:flagellar motor switch/type III secretory pathway protein FliN|nr:hypothetical protein [bacterium]